MNRLLTLVLLVLACQACSTVKFVVKNPWTGEVWTVYKNPFGSDTLTYCSPVEGSVCVQAEIVDSPPPAETPAAPTPGPAPAPSVTYTPASP
jgi:hypothetical protein